MPQFDHQIDGTVEDGSRSGAKRVRVERGDLVRLPFRRGQFFSDVTGGAGVTEIFSGTLTAGLGSGGHGLSVGLPSGLNPGVRIWYPFRGRAFGICWRRGTTFDFTVTVDGESFPVEGSEFYLPMEGLAAMQDDDASLIATDSLPDGSHMAEITCVSDPNVSRTLILYAVLLDKLAGYPVPQPVETAISTTTLTTSPVEIPSNRTAENPTRGVSEIIYTNTTVTDRIVTVKTNYGSGVVTVWRKKVPADSVEVLAFRQPQVLNSTWTHECDAAAAVNATPMGSYD